MNLNLNFPQATVISTLIVTTGITGGLLNLKDSPSNSKNYATVNYDGGYAKIGVIYDENVYSQAKVIYLGEKECDGDFAKVKACLLETVPNNKTAKTTELLAGVSIEAVTGVEWSGSRKSFRLETDSISLKSTKEEELNVAAVISKFDEMLDETKRNRKKTSRSSISLGKNPDPGSSNEWTNFFGQVLDLSKDYLPY